MQAGIHLISCGCCKQIPFIEWNFYKLLWTEIYVFTMRVLYILTNRWSDFFYFIEMELRIELEQIIGLPIIVSVLGNLKKKWLLKIQNIYDVQFLAILPVFSLFNNHMCLKSNTNLQVTPRWGSNNVNIWYSDTKFLQFVKLEICYTLSLYLILFDCKQ